MSPDDSKSLAEILGLPILADPAKLRATAAERHVWLTTPIGNLPAEGIWSLMRSAPGADLLVPRALVLLEADPTLLGLLTQTLGCAEYPWLDWPDSVRRLRSIIPQALSDLNEWDGTAEIVIEANRQRCALFEAWALFERRLSQVP